MGETAKNPLAAIPPKWGCETSEEPQWMGGSVAEENEISISSHAEQHGNSK